MRINTSTALKFLITMHIDSILRKIILHQDTQVHPFVKKREKTHAYIYHDIMCIKASRFLLSVYALIPHLERSYYTRHANTTKKHMNSCVRVTQPTRVTCMLELEFVSSPRACLVSSRAARVHRLQNSRAVRPLLHTRDATDREQTSPRACSEKCHATVGGAARTSAAPLRVALHSRCGARRVDVAATAAPLAVASHHHLLRHWEWRGQKGLFG
jgi:hypothetical protein